MAKRTPQQVKQFLERQAPEDELPLVPEFYDFAYSDEGSNDPLRTLLEREETEELVLEVITVGNHTSVHFHYKEQS